MLAALTRAREMQSESGECAKATGRRDKSKLFSSNIFFSAFASRASGVFFSLRSLLIYNAKLCQGQCVVNANYHRLTQFPAWCCRFVSEVFFSFFFRALARLFFFSRFLLLSFFFLSSFAAASESHFDIERRHCLETHLYSLGLRFISHDPQRLWLVVISSLNMFFLYTLI